MYANFSGNAFPLLLLQFTGLAFPFAVLFFSSHFYCFKLSQSENFDQEKTFARGPVNAAPEYL